MNLGHILIEPKQEDGYYDIFLREKDNKHVFHTILALYQMNYLISIAYLIMLKEYRRRWIRNIKFFQIAEDKDA